MPVEYKEWVLLTVVAGWPFSGVRLSIYDDYELFVAAR